MATCRRVMRPNGRVKELYFSPGQDRMKIVEDVLLRQNAEFCEGNWLEPSVSYFLSGCADVLLEGNADDVLSPYRTISASAREVPVSSCTPDVQTDITGASGGKWTYHKATDDATFEQMMERYDRKAKRGEWSRRKKQNKRSPSRFNKLQSLRGKYPSAVFSFERVDTEGVFSSGGTYYELPPDAPGYKAKSVGDDTQYDMDQVMVVREIVEDGENIFFYNQDVEEVFPNPV